ncbi:serine/threonine-protein kinase [Anaeromyxobacter terrae]|uniref:serine/threonine-protein kinase n=1 Tax=Anaeromyxobacter terrae TaxID=2925406 RepID=UPI001F5A1804|nr:serine/threonine-protein kinase [Anaeromyxobacter sp. SG22]
MSEISSTVVGTAPTVDVGTALGSYELVGLLGRGAMGCVYRARHIRLGREVAIKVLNPEYVARPDVVERFFREARVVNDIDHEHIVEVTDFVEAPGLAYLVMELLEGASLRELMTQRGRKYPPLNRMLRIMTQVCEALEAAHEKGVVHRDLKPDNIFVVERDGADFVKVLDFGVAKLRDPVDHAATSAGMVLGTPHYMAPEQALGRDVDRRADIWAAGVVLYELLSGKVPFTAPSFVELAIFIREQPQKALPRRTPRGERIPAWLAAVLTKSLEKRPDDRFESMATLAKALRAPRRRRTIVRSRSLLAAVASAAIVATGAAVAVRFGVTRNLGAALESGRTLVRELESEARTDPSPSSDATGTSIPPPSSISPPTATRSPAGTSSPTSTSVAPATSQRPATTSRATSPSRTMSASGPQQRGAVELVIRSSPPGASVVRLDTGQRLGKTPLRVNVARKAAAVWLRMTLDGYRPVKFAVDLRKDNTANVPLHGVAKKPKVARRRR